MRVGLRRRVAIGLALAVAWAMWAGALGQAPEAGSLEIELGAALVRAEGGSTELEVRASGGGLSAGDRVSLTSTLGAFGGESGPSRAALPLRRSGGMLTARVQLFGDGRPGDALVRAEAGGLRASAEVGFAGAPASLRAVDDAGGGAGSGAGGDVFAADVHEFTVEARDAGGRAVPGASVSWEVTAGAALLDGGSPRAVSRADAAGRASASLEGAPGMAELTARSGGAELRFGVRLHELPSALRLLRLSDDVVERGSAGEAGSVLVLLTDGAGRGTPGQAVEVTVSASGEGGGSGAGPRLASDQEGGAFRTDARGQILAHVDARAAAGGEYEVRAVWRHPSLELEAVMPVSVAGPPSALYLSAMELAPPSADAPEAYTVLAAAADGSGRAVAEGYHVRWALASAPRGSSISTALSPVSGGEARAVLTLGAGDAPAGGVTLRAWLLEAPRVSAEASLENVTGAGTALRRGVNRVIWRGERAYIHDAMAPIAHVGGTAWRRDDARGEWQGYELEPGAVDYGFVLERGDELRIRVESAVLLPRVTR